MRKYEIKLILQNITLPCKKIAAIIKKAFEKDNPETIADVSVKEEDEL